MTPDNSQEKLPFRRIAIELLEVSDANVRQQNLMADIDDLAESMNEIGLKQPIVVQSKNGHYEILIGQRRFSAAKQLGWSHIDARVEDAPRNPVESKIVSFSENIQRRDISPDDKADACRFLLEELGSVAEVARRLKITPQTVRKWLGYAAVPERLKALVGNQGITAPQAIRLAQFVGDEDKAVEIATEMIAMRSTPAQRSRVLAAIQEAPERPVDSVFRRADEMQHERSVTVVLPAQWGLALDRAARSLQTSATEVARDAIIEWLDGSRY